MRCCRVPVTLPSTTRPAPVPPLQTAGPSATPRCHHSARQVSSRPRYPERLTYRTRSGAGSGGGRRAARYTQRGPAPEAHRQCRPAAAACRAAGEHRYGHRRSGTTAVGALGAVCARMRSCCPEARRARSAWITLRVSVESSTSRSRATRRAKSSYSAAAPARSPIPSSSFSPRRNAPSSSPLHCTARRTSSPTLSRLAGSSDAIHAAFAASPRSRSPLRRDPVLQFRGRVGDEHALEEVPAIERERRLPDRRRPRAASRRRASEQTAVASRPISSSPRVTIAPSPRVFLRKCRACRRAPRACSWSSSGQKRRRRVSRRRNALGGRAARWASRAKRFACIGISVDTAIAAAEQLQSTKGAQLEHSPPRRGVSIRHLPEVTAR